MRVIFSIVMVLATFLAASGLSGAAPAKHKAGKGTSKQDKAPPPDLEACQLLLEAGNVKIDQKDPSGAAEEFQRALKLCPEPCAAMAGLGLSSFALGNKLDAIAWVEKATACNPANKDLVTVLAGLRRDLDRASRQPVRERPLPDAMTATSALPGPPPRLPAIAPTENHDGYYVGKECDIQGCAPLKVTIQGDKIEGAIYDKDNKPFITVTGTIDLATGNLKTTYKGALKLLGMSFELKGDCTGRVSKGYSEGTCKGTDAFGAAANFKLKKRKPNEPGERDLGHEKTDARK